MALGYPHPDYLLAQLTAEQWNDWLAFYEWQPFGQQREDYRQVAQIMYLLRPHQDRPAADLPELVWPYWRPGGLWAPTEQLLEFQKRFDQALLPHNGGYRLATPIGEIMEAVTHDDDFQTQHQANGDRGAAP